MVDVRGLNRVCNYQVIMVIKRDSYWENRLKNVDTELSLPYDKLGRSVFDGPLSPIAASPNQLQARW